MAVRAVKVSLLSAEPRFRKMKPLEVIQPVAMLVGEPDQFFQYRGFKRFGHIIRDCRRESQVNFLDPFGFEDLQGMDDEAIENSQFEIPAESRNFGNISDESKHRKCANRSSRENLACEPLKILPPMRETRIFWFLAATPLTPTIRCLAHT